METIAGLLADSVEGQTEAERVAAQAIAVRVADAAAYCQTAARHL